MPGVPDGELPNYGMKNYLKALGTEKPNEITVITLRELNEIKEQLINEKTRPQIFIVGNKSLVLYDPIKKDLMSAGYNIGFLDIYRSQIHVTYEKDLEFEGEYILLTDSIRTGKEVCDLIRLRKGKVKRIYSNFSTDEGKKRIMKEHGLTEDIFRISMGVSEDVAYRKKLLRNKVFNIIHSKDIGFDTGTYSESFFSNMEMKKFVALIKKSIQDVMTCSQIGLEKNSLFNLMLPANIHIYVNSCVCDDKTCLKWFKDPKTGEPFFDLVDLFLWIYIEKRDTLLNVVLAFDCIYDNRTFPPKSRSEPCSISNVYKCSIGKTSRRKEIRMINRASHCKICLNTNIYDKIAQEIFKNINNKISLLA